MLKLRSSWMGYIGVFFGISAYASPVNQMARIDSIEGADKVLLQSGLSLRDVARGELIRSGERIRTDEKTTVVVSYPDGSRLTVMPNTDLEINEATVKSQNSQLRSGVVRGAVNKVPSEASPRIHFVIRTKAAVMGVRGTEFFAAADAVSGVSQFNTLEGLVEVASDPVSLLGGKGVPVSIGQAVAATESGIGKVIPFNSTDFLKRFGDGEANPASVSSATSSASSQATTQAEAEVQQKVEAVQAPPPPPPRLTDPLKAAEMAPAAIQEKLKMEEADKPTFHLLSFAAGAFFSKNPHGDGRDPNYYRAVSLAWTPSIPLPIVPFIVARASIGAIFAQNGSLNNRFVIHDFEAFAVLTLLRPLFVEVGGGEQIWLGQNIDAGVFSANAGLILSENGRWNRIYVGVSQFQAEKKASQIRAGIGLQF